MQTVQEILCDELSKRKQALPDYSLRTYSEDLEIARSTLFDLLSGKRQPSNKSFQKLQKHFPKLNSFKEPSKNIRHEILKEKEFSLISDWEYMAILNLVKIKDHVAKASWISERLGISEHRAKVCLNNLINQGHLKIQNSKMSRIHGAISTSTDISSSAIRKHHIQAINLAEDALFNTPIQLREFLSATLAIDIENLPQMKDEIFEVYKKFSKKFDEQNANEVYKLNIQFFPCKNTEQ